MTKNSDVSYDCFLREKQVQEIERLNPNYFKPKKKGNKHYKVGYSLERDTKIALEQQGYTVFRSAGSHSMADLIALKPNIMQYDVDPGGISEEFPYCEVRLIQCKRHKKGMTKLQLQSFRDSCMALFATPMIAYRDKGIHIEQVN